MAGIDTATASADGATEVVLVRHGQAQNNADELIGGHTAIGLTELGHRQAEATARALAASADPMAPTAVVASDLARAAQTAAPIARACGLELSLDARLRERSLGELDGLKFVEAKRRYPEVWRRLMARDPALDPPGGESVPAVFARVSAALEDTVAAHAGGRVVVVSHGIAIFHALMRILGTGSPADGPRWFALVDNCSLSSFRHGHGGWLVRSINHTCHLRGLTGKSANVG